MRVRRLGGSLLCCCCCCCRSTPTIAQFPAPPKPASRAPVRRLRAPRGVYRKHQQQRHADHKRVVEGPGVALWMWYVDEAGKIWGARFGGQLVGQSKRVQLRRLRKRRRTSRGAHRLCLLLNPSRVSRSVRASRSSHAWVGAVGRLVRALKERGVLCCRLRRKQQQRALCCAASGVVAPVSNHLAAHPADMYTQHRYRVCE